MVTAKIIAATKDTIQKCDTTIHMLKIVRRKKKENKEDGCLWERKTKKEGRFFFHKIQKPLKLGRLCHVTDITTTNGRDHTYSNKEQ